MASMRNIDFKDVTNARIASRMKQVVILVIATVIGLIASAFLGA
ncbi:MAG TPA: hypothetical protein PLJ60_14290 [Chryseolinea sp.]|nr:hypothetical protein [Chryseolinea sp.]